MGLTVKQVADLAGIATIAAAESGREMGNSEMFDEFDESKIEEYKDEVRRKFGNKQVDESKRRTSKYSKADWDEIKTEAREINLKIAAAMDRGPADSEVQKQVGLFFAHINDRFYTCSPAMFEGLGEMYVTDPRFTAFYEKFRPGMAEFMRDAMKMFAEYTA